jgi:hypothetical protein
VAYYTVVATTATRTFAACALVDAISDQDATRRAHELRESGQLDFLPIEAKLCIRRASRVEIQSYQSFMALKPGKAPAAYDTGLSARNDRLRRAFFEKLWRREITPQA